MSWLTNLLSINKGKLEIGDVWVMDENNPFALPLKVKIVDLKKGYVLYLVLEQEGRDVAYCDEKSSKSEGDFKFIYHKE